MKRETFIVKSARQTQKLGKNLAEKILNVSERGASVVLALRGDLGSGKTTFLQGFAKGLGIKEKILSPTFVIMKRFQISNSKFRNFYHFDCYRLKGSKDISELGFSEIIKNPENILAIEWPEKIKKILPENIIFINFKFIDKNTRQLTISI